MPTTSPAPQRGAQTPAHRPQWHGVWLQRCVSAGIAVVAFVLLLAIHAFLIEKFFATESANVERATAVLGSSVYDERARADVVVMELNDNYLEFMGASWPPNYMVYRALLEDIAQYQPQSIFMDITLVHSRTDQGLDDLVRSMCRISASGVALYLAALENEAGQLYLREGLNGPELAPCFTKVGVRYDPDPNTHLATTYPVLGNGELLEGEGTAAARSARADIASAAYAVARGVAQQQARELASRSASAPQAGARTGPDLTPLLDLQGPHTMSLAWGMGDHAPSSAKLWARCNVTPSVWAEMLPHAVRAALWPAPPCPYHLHVPLAWAASPYDDADFEQLRGLIEGKHVMVGAVISGVHDVVNAPIQGFIPGVYMHAMALDNLLTYGAQFKQPAPLHETNQWLFWGLGMALGLGSFAIYMASQACAKLLRQGRQRPQPNVAGVMGAAWHSAGAPLQLRSLGAMAQVLGREVWDVLVWVLAKIGEIACSLGLSLLCFHWVLSHTHHSIQDLVQLCSIVLALQWTGITGQVIKSAHNVLFCKVPT